MLVWRRIKTRVIIVNEDDIRHEIGIIKLQIFINVVMVIIITLSVYVAFSSLVMNYNEPGIKGVLSKVIAVLIFILISMVGCINKQIYYLLKKIRALLDDLSFY